MKNPERLAEILIFEEHDGPHARRKSGESVALSGLDVTVLRAADGTRDVQAILAMVQGTVRTATRETVFASLDRLADAGLLAARIAPPAHGNRTTRRDMMRLVGTAAACAVVSGPAASAFGLDLEAQRGGELYRKAAREAEDRAKQLVAQEQEQKQGLQAAEETVKTERRDVIEAEQNLNAAERDLRAAERDNKRRPSQAAEETQKLAERDVDLATRVAEKEHKDLEVAQARAEEMRQKYQQRVSEEVAKKTDKSDAARARRFDGDGSAGEMLAKAAEALTKGAP